MVKKELKQEWDANTVYSLYITPCREGRGVIYRVYTVC